MQINIVVQGGPHVTDAGLRAISCCRSLVAEGHVVNQVFFHGDAVRLLHNACDVPSNENNLPALWHDLIKTHALNAIACISSVEKRGVTPIDGVQIAGLGQSVDASLSADRTLVFK